MKIIYWSCLFWILFSCNAEEAPKKSLTPPNILWITCEDISPNIGAFGDTYANTPNLDKLATQGVVYKKAFASAPVCAVARSSIISGMYASSQGSQHMRCDARRPEGLKFYPELLREAGYYCTNNSKTDYNFKMDHKSIWDESSNKAHWRNRPDPERPFFAIFNFTTSHESRVNNDDRYAQAVADLPEGQLKKPGEVPLPPYYPDTEKVRELWARYYNIITAMDQQVGEILAQLEEDGLTDNTIVLFYSDHGAGIPRHKRWMYDSGLHVPLIVKVPEKYKDWLPYPAGSETDELVSFIDFPATALHLAGIPVPENMMGRAFLGEHLSPRREYIYAGRDRMDERYDMQRTVRDQQFIYIRYYEAYKPFCQYMNTPEKGAIMQAIRQAEAEGTMPEAGLHMIAPAKPQEELFDCNKDPYQLHNLANDPAYQDKLAEMRQAHAQWSDETKDTGLIPETILRKWEQDYDAAIYDIMRTHAERIPVSTIRETALNTLPIEALNQRLQHTNDAVRYWAAINLGNRPDEIKERAPLQAALQDTVPIVRIAAARALCTLNQTEKALSLLQTELQHEDEWVRLGAAQVLDEIGEQARPAIESLKGAMDDSNRYVVRVVNHALNLLLGTANTVP